MSSVTFDGTHTGRKLPASYMSMSSAHMIPVARIEATAAGAGEPELKVAVSLYPARDGLFPGSFGIAP